MKKSVITLLHLGYWAMYFLLWMLIILLYQIGRTGVVPSPDQFKFSMPLLSGFFILPGVIGFYSFYTFLFSKYLNKKKILSLFLYGPLVSVVCGLIGEIYLSIAFGGAGANKGEHIFPNYQPSEIIVAVIIMALAALANGIVGLVMRGFITSYGDIKLKADLNKKNHEMELALVKSQINPHFLFNTINNIDVLIQKDPIKASAYLNKLSDIMRFMLYETKEEKIPLKQELTYIEKYIDLQKIRTSNPSYVNYSVQGDAGNLMIAPMLFIPFIENAFKHAENKKTENAINIKVSVEKDTITFECENSYGTDTQTGLGHSGLGNELIKKRLILLYPEKHTLKVSDENRIYNVKLTISGN